MYVWLYGCMYECMYVRTFVCIFGVCVSVSASVCVILYECKHVRVRKKLNVYINVKKLYENDTM